MSAEEDHIQELESQCAELEAHIEKLEDEKAWLEDDVRRLENEEDELYYLKEDFEALEAHAARIRSILDDIIFELNLPATATSDDVVEAVRYLAYPWLRPIRGVV